MCHSHAVGMPLCNDPVLMGDRSARYVLACLCSTLLALLLSAHTGHASAPVAWHLTAVGAPEAWPTATGEGVTVAVIDSGVDADHPDLEDAVLPGRSYVDIDPGGEPRLLALGSDSRPVYERAFGQADPVGHGTAVAGLIAGSADSLHPGVAPDASILPIRVLDDENRYHDSAMVGAAVEWAVDNGADVVNLSLGGHYDSARFAEAIAYAERHDVLIVACTGNQHKGQPDERRLVPRPHARGARRDRFRPARRALEDRCHRRGDRSRRTGREPERAQVGRRVQDRDRHVVRLGGRLGRGGSGPFGASGVERRPGAPSAHRDGGAGGPGLGEGIVDVAAAVEAEVCRVPRRGSRPGSPGVERGRDGCRRGPDRGVRAGAAGRARHAARRPAARAPAYDGGVTAADARKGTESELAKKRRARVIDRLLAAAHPDAHCELDYDEPAASWRSRRSCRRSAPTCGSTEVTPASSSGTSPPLTTRRRTRRGRGDHPAHGLLPQQDQVDHRPG